MKAESKILNENNRHRFSGVYKNLRLFLELLPSGEWFAGVYDLNVDAWLWTEYVSSPTEGKRLISQNQSIKPEDIDWHEHQVVPNPQLIADGHAS